jgi:pyruvate/2-oxoglutarate dehydrogenase complex dihydrolipoamide acyltransferase (E2) component
MPQMGVSVSEGTVTRWLKQPGEFVARDEALLEISTDKVDTEIPSPGEGVLSQVLVQEGQTVEVGTLLAIIAPAGARSAETESASDEQSATGEQEEARAEPVAVEVTETVDHAPAPVPVSSQPAPPTGNGRTFVSPVVSRIAAEHGVDPNVIPGTGQGGRVTKRDILGYIEAGGSAATEAHAAHVPEPTVAPIPVTVPEPVAPTAPVAAVAPVAATAAPGTPTQALAPAQQVPAAAGEVEEPMTAMRRGVMAHMRKSLDTSAHVTSAIEVDMSRVVAAREALKGEFQQAYGVNPTYLAFISRATIDTLANWPWINGEIRGEKVVTRSFVNLGIAVALNEGRGLIVPVIRNAQDMNLLGIARAIADLAQRARTKKLLPDDVQGGTFTVTNPGGFGTFHGTPIINQPQVAILGTYALVKRPWVVQDTLGKDVIAIRPLMNITLTYDHRLVDGAYSGGFMKELRERLEAWDEGTSA